MNGLCHTDRSIFTILVAAAVSILLGIITAVLFFYNLMPFLVETFLYVIVFSLLVIALVAGLAALLAHYRLGGPVNRCACQYGYVAIVALIVFALVLVGLSIELFPSSLLSAFLVFVGATAYYFLVISVGLLFSCLLSAMFRLNPCNLCGPRNGDRL
jgi:hypothetical protein